MQREHVIGREEASPAAQKMWVSRGRINGRNKGKIQLKYNEGGNIVSFKIDSEHKNLIDLKSHDF